MEIDSDGEKAIDTGRAVDVFVDTAVMDMDKVRAVDVGGGDYRRLALWGTNIASHMITVIIQTQNVIAKQEVVKKILYKVAHINACDDGESIVKILCSNLPHIQHITRTPCLNRYAAMANTVSTYYCHTMAFHLKMVNTQCTIK